MKLPAKTTAGIRTRSFSKALPFLKEVLNLEMVHQDQEREIAHFKLPAGQILEVFGSKSLWHPFTTPPDWEMIIADIRYLKEKS